MRRLFQSMAVVAFVAALLALGRSSRAVDPPAKIDFTKQIQPLFADKCLSCHGPEKHKSDLRLDTKLAAMQGGSSGKVIIPGKSGESLLIKHVLGIEDHKRMPPEPKDPLTAEQINLLRQWIDGGADWPDEAAQTDDPRKKHWAYQPPVHVDPPSVQKTDWPRNPIDHFILARLEKEGLTPSPEADRETLIRRVTLDLIGLPPTIEEIDAFLADKSPDAYEKVVDRLLASPQYGENWARDWLDAARYADSNGYEKDRPRIMWRYRDWVIQAFNQDMPFDQFSIEQLAGDMLPNAGESQKVATAFHRNTMFNEEGGVDKEENRWRSIVDRVATTGTVFLGMTIQCAQCHNHKYDPLTQREYYQFFAILNNQDEPMLETPTAQDREKVIRSEAQIANIESHYETEWPLPYDRLTWTPLQPGSLKSAGGATLTTREDRSVIAGGTSPETDTYTFITDTDLNNVAAFRVEVLTDSVLPKMGPGRTDNGNFVLSEFTIKAASRAKPDDLAPVTLWNSAADYSQAGYPVGGSIDGDPKTGWAIDAGPGEKANSHTATFETKQVLNIAGGMRLVFSMDQLFGNKHTIGRFRISAGTLPPGSQLPAELASTLRHEYRVAEQVKWESDTAAVAADWQVLKPVTFTSKNNSTMTLLDDQSILVTGDSPNRDVYDVDFDTDLVGITAFRLEAIADQRLPFRGPGRGSGIADGDFMINELTVTAKPIDNPAEQAVPVKWKGASATFIGGFGDQSHRPELAIDGHLDSGWSIIGGTGKNQSIVFELASPLGFAKGTHLSFDIVQHYLDQHTLGRFRIMATKKIGRIQASPMPRELEMVFAMPREWRNALQQKQVDKYFLSVAPQLSQQHAEVEKLRQNAAAITTTLVMQEREKQRKTFINIRGEFLDHGEEVPAGVPAILPPLPKDQPPNRMTLARWLVDGKNPLTTRVIVNRMWQNYFGRGLVTTTEDFGLRAEKPSHPELLDWLATEFVRQKWSMKAMHRLIVTSATYRQRSYITPDLQQHDPYNVLLARGPRGRIPAELVRDTALRVSGLLSTKIGGPSVYPPQPLGVTSLGHGDAGWPTSTGEDKYRRGIYTFWRRSTPFAGMITFDAPTRDICVVKRPRSNTPLQALTVLNDPVFIEAAQALARRVMEHGPPDVRERIIFAFRLTTGRNPQSAEVDRLQSLFDKELTRFPTPTTEPATIALPDPKQAPPAGVDVRQLAAWTIVANVLLNLDETITKG